MLIIVARGLILELREAYTSFHPPMRAVGVGPTFATYKVAALPLSYARF